jgi:pimeloyl-ACP methyl ester carboxylesterase
VNPETKYAKSNGLNIAYQVIGDGPLDLVFVMGWVSHLDYFWEEPSFARFLRRLASFSRLIAFDKRGTGLSDRVSIKELPTLEERMDDVRAVMDAAGSQRAALMGISEGAPLCALFAATYPERTSALVIIGGYARRIWDNDYPWGIKPEQRRAFLDEIKKDWGGPVGLAERAPSMAHDERFRRWWATYLRMGASPGAVLALTEMNSQIDVRQVLPAIRVPTLILHRTGDLTLAVEQGRYMAEKVPGAQFVELPGDDHLPFVGDQDALIDEVEEFLTGVRPAHEPDRVLATVMFTDIVGSTERVRILGDRAWRDLLESHDAMVRKHLERYRGREVTTTGDGFLATFDGPARAIRCACEIAGDLRAIGIEIKAGVHTGECEVRGEDIRGIAIHIAARVAELANPGEVLASGTVRDLVAGSGIEFQDRGAHTLKGISDEWRLFAIRC